MPKPSFSAKLQFFVLALVTVVVASLSGLFYYYLMHSVKNSFFGVTSGFAYYLLRSHNVSEAIHNGSLPQIERQIAANLEMQEQILYVALINRQGQILLDTTGGDIAKIIRNDRQHSWILDTEQERTFFLRGITLRNKSFDIANVILPIYHEGVVWGGGVVGVSAAHLFRHILPQAMIFIAFLFLGFVSFSFVSLFILIRILLKPIRVLTEGTEKIFEQNFETEVPVHGEDDIARLAEAFNRLMSYLKDMITRLQGQSLVDALTGCYQMLFFQKQLAVELERAQRFRDPLCTGWIELANYMRLANGHGQVIADQALKAFAEILKKSMRHIDVLARAENQRFGIILPKTDMAGAEIVFNRIRDLVSRSPFRDEMGRPLGPLIFNYGVVFCDASEEGLGHTQEDLLKRADTALQEARAQGQNRGLIVQLMALF